MVKDTSTFLPSFIKYILELAEGKTISTVMERCHWLKLDCSKLDGGQLTTRGKRFVTIIRKAKESESSQRSP